LPSSVGNFEAERAELEAVLASGMIGRTNNLVRLLTFVCEKHFEGASAEIKEYNIAVQALGRPHDFDPQVDTIVRVTAHALRKRLEDYYRSDGADHAVRICLPPGGYVPKFAHRSAADPEHLHLKTDETYATHPPNGGPHPNAGPQESRQEFPDEPLPVSAPNDAGGKDTAFAHTAARKSRIRVLTIAAILGLSVCALSLWRWHWRNGISNDVAASGASADASAIPSGNILRALVGNTSNSYIDRAGANWVSDRYCSGGDKFSISGHVIQGTEDPELFSAGRRGVFQCNFPVPPGIYELHLLFAETSGFQENSRNAQFSINGGPPVNFDVVDDAAGGDIATTKVFTDVSPGADGTIRLNFTTPESFLNALEILPSTPHRMLPVRIVAGHSSYRDSKGNDWTRDRYFFGGRLSSFAGDLSNVPDGRLYEWHRFGHIHYIIPVATGGKYTLRLYFLERWFGIRNGGVGVSEAAFLISLATVRCF
jgi:hypothetical protein